MVVALAGFVATAISNIIMGGGIAVLVASVSFFGFLLWLFAVLGVSHTVRCPSCQKRLGYLLLDPSYSKTFAPIVMPSDIPTTITACPYCHADFEKEMTGPEAGEHRR